MQVPARCWTAVIICGIALSGCQQHQVNAEEKSLFITAEQYQSTGHRYDKRREQFDKKVNGLFRPATSLIYIYNGEKSKKLSPLFVHNIITRSSTGMQSKTLYHMYTGMRAKALKEAGLDMQEITGLTEHPGEKQICYALRRGSRQVGNVAAVVDKNDVYYYEVIGSYYENADTLLQLIGAKMQQLPDVLQPATSSERLILPATCCYVV